MWRLAHNFTVLTSYPFEKPQLPWVGLFSPPPVPTQLLLPMWVSASLTLVIMWVVYIIRSVSRLKFEVIQNGLGEKHICFFNTFDGSEFRAYVVLEIKPSSRISICVFWVR